MAVSGDGGVTRVRRAADEGALAGSESADLDLAALFFEASANVSSGRRFQGVPAEAGAGHTTPSAAQRKGGDFAVSGRDAAAWLPAVAARWWVTFERWIRKAPSSATPPSPHFSPSPAVVGEWVVGLVRPVAMELALLLVLCAVLALVSRRWR